MNKKKIPEFEYKNSQIWFENPDVIGLHGRTLLMNMIFENPASVPMLLKQKIDVNIQDDYKDTALIFASQKGLTNIVKELIVHGADINIKGNSDKTALLHATREGHTNVVKVLLENNANQKIKDDCGNTPLSIAKSYRRDEIIKLLLQYEFHK